MCLFMMTHISAQIHTAVDSWKKEEQELTDIMCYKIKLATCRSPLLMAWHLRGSCWGLMLLQLTFVECIQNAIQRISKCSGGHTLIGFVYVNFKVIHVIKKLQLSSQPGFAQTFWFWRRRCFSCLAFLWLLKQSRYVLF